MMRVCAGYVHRCNCSTYAVFFGLIFLLPQTDKQLTIGGVITCGGGARMLHCTIRVSA